MYSQTICHFVYEINLCQQGQTKGEVFSDGNITLQYSVNIVLCCHAGGVSLFTPIPRTQQINIIWLIRKFV